MSERGIFVKVLPMLEMGALRTVVGNMESVFQKAGANMSKSMADADRAIQQATANAEKATRAFIDSGDAIARNAEKQATAEENLKRVELDRAETQRRTTEQWLQNQARMEIAEHNLNATREALHLENMGRLDEEMLMQQKLTEAQITRALTAQKAYDDAARATSAEAMAAMGLQNKKAADNVEEANKKVQKSHQDTADSAKAANAANEEMVLANDAVTASLINRQRAEADAHAATQNRIRNMAGWTVAGGTALFVGEGVKQAASLQDAMQKLITVMHEDPGKLPMIQQQLSQLSIETGESVNKLSDGLLRMESFGYKGQDALQALTNAAKLAKIEHIELSEAVNGLGITLNDSYGHDVGQAERASAQIVAGRSVGNYKDMGELMGSLHNIDPRAALLMHADPGTVMGLLGSASQSGVSPDQAAMNFDAMLRVMTNPNQMASKLLSQQFGINPQELAHIANDPSKGGILGAMQTVFSAIESKKGADGLIQLKATGENEITRKHLQNVIDNGGFSDNAKQLAQNILDNKDGATIAELTPSKLNKAYQAGNITNEDIAKFYNFKTLYGGLGLSSIAKKDQDTEQDEATVMAQIFGADSLRFFASTIGTPEALKGTQERISKINEANPADFAKEFSTAMDTLNAQVDKFKQSWNNLERATGDQLLPALKNALTVFNDIANALSKHPAILQTIVNLLELFTARFLILKTISGGGALLDAIGGGFMRMQKPISDAENATKNFGNRMESTLPGQIQRGTKASENHINTFATNAASKLGGILSILGLLGGNALGDSSDPMLKDLGNAGQWAALGYMVGGPWGALLGGGAGLGTMLYHGVAGIKDQDGSQFQAQADAANKDMGKPAAPGLAHDQLRDAIQSGNNPALAGYSIGPNGQILDPKGNPLPGFASGTSGILPGYSPGVDNILGMVGGKPVGLSGGEAILVPEAARALGPAVINGINGFFTAQRGGGGFTGPLGMLAGALNNILLGEWGMTPEQQAAAYASLAMPMGAGGLSSAMLTSASSQGPSWWGVPTGGVKGAVYKAFKEAGFDDSQWAAVDYIISHESSWNPTNVNPNGGAYGLFQFLNHQNDKYGQLGAYSRDPYTQAVAGMQYIKDRYGSPNAARAYWEAHRNYSLGGIVGYANGTASVPFPSDGTQGQPDYGVSPEILSVEQIARGFGLPMTPQGGYRPYSAGDAGGHSFHGSGEAGDFGNGDKTDAELAFAAYMYQNYGSQLAELIHDDPRWSHNIKDGKDVGAFGNVYTMSSAGYHGDHVHVAFRHQGGSNQDALTMGGGSLSRGGNSPLSSLMGGGFSGGSGGLGGGFSGGGGGGSTDPWASYNPLTAAGSGGFTLPNIVRVLTTFLLEEAFGNPLGRLAAMNAGGGMGSVVPTGGYTQEQIEAMNPAQRDLVKQTQANAAAQRDMALLQQRMAEQIQKGHGPGTPEYDSIWNRMQALQDRTTNRMISDANRQDKQEERDKAKADREAKAASKDQAKLDDMLKNPIFYSQSQIDAQRAKVAGHGGGDTSAAPDLGNLPSGGGQGLPLFGPHIKLDMGHGSDDNGGLGGLLGAGDDKQGPKAPGASLPPILNQNLGGTNPYIGKAPLGKVVVGHDANGNPVMGTPAERAFRQSFLGPTPAHTVTPDATHQPGSVGPGGQGGSSGGSGAGSSLILDAAAKAAPALDALAPGAGEAAKVGLELANRAIGYGGQVAGTLAGGVLETIGLHGSVFSDPEKSLFARVGIGVLGAHPSKASTNTAGKLKTEEKQGGGDGEKGPAAPQINIGTYNNGNQNEDQMYRDMHRWMNGTGDNRN